jgi:hypothetical protein
MDAEPAVAASPELPIAAAPVPLVVNVPTSRLLRLPAALLLELANEFLEDEDVQMLAQTCSSMPTLLRTYRIKKAINLSSALAARHHSPLARQAALPASAAASLLLRRAEGGANLAQAQEWVASMRFGVVSTVVLDARASTDDQLAAQLQRLPLNVRNVRVLREVFGVSFPRSKVAAVTTHLPSHIRSLVFDHEGWAAHDEKEQMFKLLPPLSQWTLPVGLTELHLPRLFPLPLDQSASGEQQAERLHGLPASLIRLRLGDELDHSLTHVQLPASLHVLHFGAAWSQPVEHWPQLPDGLEELVLPSTYPRPLSSLQFPRSLRKLHFLSLFCAGRHESSPSKSCLLEDTTAGMFPPALESLLLPCPVVRDGRTVSVASIDSPLDVSLFPTSLSTLCMGDQQSLCCTGNVALILQNLRIESLVVASIEKALAPRPRSLVRGTLGKCYHPGTVYRTVNERFDGVEACRAELQRRLTMKPQMVASGQVQTASTQTAAPSSSTSALPLTMDTSKRG